jgi:hypothetical protein
MAGEKGSDLAGVSVDKRCLRSSPTAWLNVVRLARASRSA